MIRPSLSATPNDGNIESGLSTSILSSVPVGDVQDVCNMNNVGRDLCDACVTFLHFMPTGDRGALRWNTSPYTGTVLQTQLPYEVYASRGAIRRINLFWVHSRHCLRTW